MVSVTARHKDQGVIALTVASSKCLTMIKVESHRPFPVFFLARVSKSFAALGFFARSIPGLAHIRPCIVVKIVLATAPHAFAPVTPFRPRWGMWQRIWLFGLSLAILTLVGQLPYRCEGAWLYSIVPSDHVCRGNAHVTIVSGRLAADALVIEEEVLRWLEARSGQACKLHGLLPMIARGVEDRAPRVRAGLVREVSGRLRSRLHGVANHGVLFEIERVSRLQQVVACCRDVRRTHQGCLLHQLVRLDVDPIASPILAGSSHGVIAIAEAMIRVWVCLRTEV